MFIKFVYYFCSLHFCIIFIEILHYFFDILLQQFGIFYLQKFAILSKTDSSEILEKNKKKPVEIVGKQ